MPVECTKCRFLNPDTSRFCGNCAAPLATPRPESSPSATPVSGAAPHPPATPGPDIEAPTLTKTIDAPFAAIPLGTLIAGKYRIIEQIGRGGMGLVYKAEDIKLRRTVALKFLPPELMSDPRARERFVQEAQAASALDHPNICTIHEIDETADGRMFINMACYCGESLKDRIGRGRVESGEAMSIASQVARGLAAAHGRGIVHRDIKPGNIVITGDGVAKILDFGLAKLSGEARLTRPGHAVGTVAYISPEQLTGDAVDGRADVWSLGVVLYEMLSGELPFSGDTENAFVYSIVNRDPRIPGNLPETTPRGLLRIIDRALAKNPAKRFGSAGEMAEAIDALRSGPAPTPASGVARFVDRVERLIRRRKAVAAAASVIALAAVLAPFFLPERGRSVAFLPLTVAGGTGEDSAFADGLSEFLSRKLDGIVRHHRRSWVHPVGEALENEVREAGDARRILGADIAVSGTVRRTGGQVALNLVAVDSGKLRRIATLPRTDHIANIATWQQDVVLDLARALGFEPTDRDGQILSAAGTMVPAAFESYVLGLGHLVHGDTATDLDPAITAFREVLAADPSFAEAATDLAFALFRKSVLGGDESQVAEAEALCLEILSKSDAFARAHFVLGRILRNRKRTGEAIDEFKHALRIDPGFYDARIAIGLALEDANRPAEAEAAYRDALRSRPKYWLGYARLGYLYFYGFQNAFAGARDMFLRVTELCPGYIHGWNNLGAAYFKLGDYDRAGDAFEKSNDVKRNPGACSNLATIYYWRGRYADAVTMYEAAVGFNPDDYWLWGNLADAYACTPTNKAKARDAYLKAIELGEKQSAASPGDVRLRARLANYLVKAGLPDRARAEIEAALRDAPDDATVVHKSILVFELAGDRARALESVRVYAGLGAPMDEISKDPFLASLREDPGYREAAEGGAGKKKTQ